MSGEAAVRASDEDRDRAAAELREHYAQGRLGPDELEDRLASVYAARTTGELEALQADLPAAPAPARDRRSELTRELLQQTGGALAPFLVCTLIWLFTGANGSFWPAWLLLVAAIPLLRNGWRLYGPSPELDAVEADLAARRRRRGLPPPRPPRPF
jgi:hypothetical protein